VLGQDCTVGSTWNGTDCTCNAGFYREHDVCVECPLHHICLNEMRRAVAEFDPGLRTLSPGTAVLEDAVCARGMFRTSVTDVCKPCPRDFFCPSERVIALPNVVRCAENQFTYATGAESSSDCVCLAGFKMILDDTSVQCLPCTEGQRCQDGSVVEELCHLQNKVASASHDMCVCKAGFEMLNFECIECTPGFVKPTAGDTQCNACADAKYAINSIACLPCPEYSDAKAGSATCTCAAPFVWNSSACEICPANHFWLNQACHACPAKSISVSSSSMLLGPAACLCARGYIAQPQNISGVLQCVPCADGQYEDDGVCVQCPSGAWAPSASIAVPKSSNMASVCVCNNTCQAQLVDGSCAGQCATTPVACRQCTPGFNKSSFSTAGNTEVCSMCAEGTFQGAFGALLCINCPTFEWHELHGVCSFGLIFVSARINKRHHHHQQLCKFHCATCAVSKRTRRYRLSKRVKVAAAKRATQARMLRTRKPSSDADLNDSRNAEHAGEQEAQKQGSSTAIKQLTCHGCQRIFGSAQGLASHLKDSYR
jgi:hypothetical protein